MTLMKWNPFEGLTSIQDEIDSMFNQRLGLKNAKADLLNSNWVPAVNIHEDNENYFFDVESPGMDRDDFDVNIENHVLSIKGEKKREEKKKEKNYYREEISYGSFMRSFSLPELADSSKVNAEYDNGVLKLKISKRETVKPKKVEIKVK